MTDLPLPSPVFPDVFQDSLPPPLKFEQMRTMANAIRALTMDAVEKAKSGHPGMPMGMADVATVLFTRHLRFDPQHPHWPDRDRFVLSAGHGSMLLYSLLHLTGYPDMSIEELQKFRQWGSRTAGHPEFGHTSGVETTTGPLGQGLATAVGMALAERILNARFGDSLVDHRTYVIAGDGCLMEGISQEAISFAGHLRLNRLIVLWDDNRISIDGPIELCSSEDQLARFAAAGWATDRIDGHDPLAIDAALTRAKKQDRPTLIACRTVIAYGSPNKAGHSSAHGAPLGAAEISATRTALNWPHAPFTLPAPLQEAWRKTGARGAVAFSAWSARLNSAPTERVREFERVMNARLPSGFAATIEGMKLRFSSDRPKLATRQASQAVIDALVEVMPELLGGSADLTGSNLTKGQNVPALAPGRFDGRYIYYGIREHAMAAAMNGLALHGGIVPFGGTFLVFSDYCRPAIRLSALMGQRVIYVMTHDSIGLGEDGPTHQPVEHLAALRAIPNLLVFRPADAVETAEVWALALSANQPSILALTRQSLPTLRTCHTADNLSARGAYILADATGPRKATLLATGSEVSIALTARNLLQEQGVATAVISMPSFELFERQDAAYKTHILGSGVRVAVEAASRFGWERYIGSDGATIGMSGFGASAPAEELYRRFAITPQAVAAAVVARL